MSKIKVEGHSDLIRDLSSNAVINTSQTEYISYMSKYKVREKNNDILRDAVKEINSLKSELFEIKKMLEGVIKK